MKKGNKRTNGKNTGLIKHKVSDRKEEEGGMVTGVTKRARKVKKGKIEKRRNPRLSLLSGEGIHKQINNYNR